MHEALYRFIHARYTEILAVLPVTLLLIGLFIAVGSDAYLQKRHKRTMLVICTLVFSLIAQNLMDHLLTIGEPMIMLRRVVDIYGYSIRPVILLLFLSIISRNKPRKAYWALVGINAGIYLTALFTDICFTIDANNRFQGGYPVLKDSCLIRSRRGRFKMTPVRICWSSQSEPSPPTSGQRLCPGGRHADQRDKD